MTRGEFLKLIGFGAVTTAVSTIPGVAESAALQTDKLLLPKGTERLSFGMPNQEAVVDKPITVMIIGAGSRGQTYAAYASQYPKALKVVGVADINKERSLKMVETYGIDSEYVFGDWSEALSVAKFADAVVISTPDHLHYEPCMKALSMGYDVLLEKPVAQTEKECTDILAQAKKYGRIVGVCHVLRYAPYFRAMKKVIDEGRVGEIVSVQHLEPIRFHHMAHSYVRGNWHNSKETTPIILAKSCHDLDLLRWMVNKPCKDVSAFGGLMYFKRENAPENSAERCLDCAVESQCPFSAEKIYLREHRYLYVFDLPNDKSERDGIIREKLRTTDYGRCVFRCNNDQCDHYVVNMQFDGGLTATLSMEAFTSYGGRKTRIMGTKGDIVGDMTTFTLTDFLTGKKYVWDEDISTLPGYEGHAGGDWGIVKDFILAVANHDEKYLSSTIDVSVESHVIGFKAEKSRLKKKIVSM